MELKTFSRDAALGRLPLPSVKETLARLRTSIEAFATPQQLAEFDTVSAQVLPRLDAAQEVLQKRHESQDNWLSTWWDSFAYLRQRYPVVVNSNIMCVRTVDVDPETWSARPLVTDPIERAAICIKESLFFRRTMIKEDLRPENVGSRALCMHQFRRYWSMRVPQLEEDVVITTAPRDVRTVVVMVNGAFFFVEAVGDDGERELSFPELIETLREGVRRTKPVPREACVGALTAAPRDVAAKGFDELRGASATNREMLDKIATCMTLVCLDTTSVDHLDAGLELSCFGNAHNRFYDRASFQIVAANGVAMYQGEHSPMDAIVSATTPVELVTQYSLESLKSGAFAAEKNREGFSPLNFLTTCEFEVPDTVRANIVTTLDAHEKFTSTCQVRGFRYGVGRAALKSLNIAPDAFVQAALCAALHRDNGGNVVATYDSASTRMFRQGRTDTIRSMSREMRDFVVALNSASRPTLGELKQLLAHAAKRHGVLTALAATGHGVDRHLLGLRVAASMRGLDISPLMNLPAVAAAGDYHLLTSQMVGKTFLGGFGHSLPYGYGACYYFSTDKIEMSLACNAATGATCVKRFSATLTSVLDEMIAVLRHAQSKL